MDAVFGWLFVSTLLSKVILFEILVGNVIVLRKHPQLRECADMALQRNMYVGARISNQTGVCEGLSHAWARNQTIESGYGYAKNVHVRLNYEPPRAVSVVQQKRETWIIPGVLGAGAKIDIHITATNFDSSALFISLLSVIKDRVDAYLYISCYPGRCGYSEYVKQDTGQTSVGPDNYWFFPSFLSHTSNQWKISFVAQRNTVCMLVDDEVVLTQNMTVVRWNYLKEVDVRTNDDPKSSAPTFRIRSFEFSEA